MTPAMTAAAAANKHRCNTCPAKLWLTATLLGCGLDGVSTFDHAAAGYCPANRYAANAPKPEAWPLATAAEVIEPAEAVMDPALGRALWAELHAWARGIDAAGLATAGAGAWLDAWEAKLPCGTCKERWRRLRAEKPEDTRSAAALFAWTVDRHDDVNEALGKPRWQASGQRERVGREVVV